MSFDGSTNYVTADGFAGTLSTDDAFTIVMWFKSNQVSQAQPYQNIQMSGLKSDGSSNVFKFGASANSTLKGIHYQDTAGASNNYKINDTVNYNDNVWHRLVITRSSGSGYQTANFYVDGVNIGNCPSQIVWDDLAKFSIGQEYDGGNTPSDFFKGLISDVQIYDKDWLQADVTYDYANPNKLAIDNPSTSLSVTNLKGYWALSEGDGLVAYDSGSNLEEEEVVNGDFAADSDWTKRNASTINDVANVANVIAGGSIGSSAANWSLESITNVFEPSKTYQIKFKAKQVSLAGSNAGAFQVGHSYGTLFDEVITSEFVDYTFTAQTSSNNWLKLTIGGRIAGDVFQIDDISVREVTASDHGGLVVGADYVDAQPRIPQLGMMNWSKGSNLFPYSEDFTEWIINSGTSQAVLAPTEAAPYGQGDVYEVTMQSSESDAYIRYATTNATLTSSTHSVWVKQAPTGSATHIRITNNNRAAWNTGTSEKIALTSSWQRLETTDSITGNRFTIIGSADASGTQDSDCLGKALIYGAQLVEGSSAGVYRFTDGGATLNSTVIPNPTIPTQDIFGNLVRDRLNSFNLDGSGYAVVADDTDLDFGTGDFTLECWVRIDGNTTRRLLDKRSTTNGYTLYLTDLNVLNLELNDNIVPGNISFVLTSSLSSNTWLHLAIVCDRSANATCYVNKAAQTPVNISSKNGNIDSTSNLFIGADAPDGTSLYSTDIISDVRLYKGKLLSATEVENNYNAGLSAHTNN